MIRENGEADEAAKKKLSIKKKDSVDGSAEVKDKKKIKKKSVDLGNELDKKEKKSIKKSLDTNDHLEQDEHKKKVKKSVDVICEENVVEMETIEEIEPKPKAKKKSTLNRITEMITKSPILEPLRSKFYLISS